MSTTTNAIRDLIEPIGSLDSFAGSWMESAPLVGAVLAECLDALAALVQQNAVRPPPGEASGHLAEQWEKNRAAHASVARLLREAAEEARTLPQRRVPESFLLRVRELLAQLARARETEHDLCFEIAGWCDLGTGD